VKEDTVDVLEHREDGNRKDAQKAAREFSIFDFRFSIGLLRRCLEFNGYQTRS
jgi:hypothetical protein